MLIITHQKSSRVRRQRCLPSSRQTEEQGHIPVLPNIARRMKRQRTSSRSQVPGRSKRHQVHHHSQHTLLHLPSVLRSQNDHLASLEVDRHTRRRGHPSCVPVCREHPGIVDYKRLRKRVRLERIQLLSCGDYQHVAHVQRMVRTTRDHAHRHSVFGIPSSKPIHHIDAILRVQIVDRPLTIHQEAALLQLHVHFTPPNVTSAARLIHHTLVLRTSTCLGSGSNAQRTGRSDVRSLLIPQSLLVQHSRSSVVEHFHLARIQAKLLHLHMLLSGLPRLLRWRPMLQVLLLQTAVKLALQMGRG
mmetsp:Transcript_81364/g.217582  ORF Transcript_81364/g.217582 Transcript_81364/m.217582 type:complete len:302 (+) Transcript_81364:1133-2038(+)